MKKLFWGVLVLAVMTSTLFTSCDETEEGSTTSDVIENLDKRVLKGNLEEDYTLDGGIYSLTGSFIVKEGATFTIPAGTQIVADASGTDIYIAVMQGAKIMINGTEASPVVMSSLSAEPGDWGGLTLCGNAITTSGVDAEAEVGGFIYGGTDAADNSGVIKYLVIKGTGAQINEDSQYNGVSFYAVGSGTTVENLAVINGADDGVEFFGGSVSVTDLFLVNNEDDAIDWTEGWDGTVTNSYIEHTIEGFSTTVEADGENNNPTLTNLTAVSTTGGTALQFKKASGATITGLSLTGYDVSVELKNEDQGSFSYIQIEGQDADPTNSYNAPATVDRSSFDWADISGVEVEVYEGDDLKGSISGIVTLDAAVEYNLSSSFIVNDGAVLIIPAGTKIVAAQGTSVYVAVMMGGKIYINGTASAPVVMTSETATAGDWGGLTICGKAITTNGVNAEAEVGGFIYGGEDAEDNSGSINYLVIKGTGAQINEDSQYNGVSLYAVGSGTTINNVAIIDGADDGVEFFGGSVTVTNIYLENNEDDAVDWTEGWDGGITNTYIMHSIDGFSTAFEGDKVNNMPYFTNVTCMSTVGGTGLQFKKTSGAAITGLFMDGYDVDIDLKGEGELADITIDGSTPQGTLIAGETHKYELTAGKDSEKVDISTWTWIDAE